MGKPEFPAMVLAGFYGAREMESYAEACVTHALAEEAKKNCGNCLSMSIMSNLSNGPRCEDHGFDLNKFALRITKCNEWKEKA